jgi:SAM-dependent MidA family methyltransferase
MQQLASHARVHGGAGLIIDYGALKSGTGDTLQAVRRHKTTDPLADPGETDLTTHVDFEHLAQITQKNNVTNLGVAEQGAFLLALGLLERAGQLGAGSDTGHPRCHQSGGRAAGRRRGNGQAVQSDGICQHRHSPTRP